MAGAAGRRTGADPSVGAARPKILFADRFVDVRLGSESPPSAAWATAGPWGCGCRAPRVDGEDAWERVQLVSGFWGLEHGFDGEGAFQWTDGDAHLRVPAGAPVCELRLAADTERAVA